MRTGSTMLERMGEFFDRRLEIYEEHQLNCIESAREFYRFTAEILPKTPGCSILDLGCGTGLELEHYFRLNPLAKVTGIDLAPGMLNRFREKFAHRDITLIQGSYFDVPFGQECFDAAVSVESLHHFSAEEEAQHRSELLRLKKEQGIHDGELFHFDTPLTVQHEAECLCWRAFHRSGCLTGGEPPASSVPTDSLVGHLPV